MQREAQEHYSGGRLKAALGVCRRMPALAPDNAKLLAFSGLVAMRLGRRNKALRSVASASAFAERGLRRGLFRAAVQR